MAGAVETGRDEDCIEYYLFFKEFMNAEVNPEVEDALQSKCCDVQALIAPHVHQYIWHHDAFNVVTKSSTEDTKDGQFPPHLYGRTHFGDNIEDEWFIVFLLLELTKQIESLVIRVVDIDGEFLLIEAADFLPRWAVPERCDRRVYLYRGEVHLIPFEESETEPQTPSVPEAVSLVLSSPTSTRADAGIQQAIQSRVKGYPAKIEDLLHQTHAYVPVGVAALLNAKPNLVAPAVMAFCNREPLDAKVCRAMRFFPPENRVMRNVLFTKCLYAMILHHSYNPDKRSGWNLPAQSNPDYKSHSLGMKLACGFEILVAKQGKGMRSTPDEEEVDLSGNPRWLHYLQSLKKYGYFQDLLEGSRDYNVLLEKAKRYFTSHYASDVELSYSTEILHLLQSTEYSMEDFKKEESNLAPPSDELWLELNPEELDKMLEERYGSKRISLGDNASSNITGHLSKFLSHVSELEGAEHPTPPPRKAKRNAEKSKAMEVSEESQDTGNKINFDPESFSCAVQNILDFVVPEDNWDLESDASSMSSYEHELDMDLDQLKRGKRKMKTSESELKQYMDQMDRELASTTIGQSFEKSEKEDKMKGETDDSFDDAENFKPVNIDMNAMKNILASYKAQMGGAGPSTNLLGPMGVRLEEEQLINQAEFGETQ
ncbi:Protein ecdysoneless [Gryllus bimaculatus]|nr:Protein ecdysoneless [Gryllus bimaculatus]